MAVRLDRALLNVVHSQNRLRAVKEIDARVHFHIRDRPSHSILRKEISAGTHGLSAKRQTGIWYVKEGYMYFKLRIEGVKGQFSQSVES